MTANWRVNMKSWNSVRHIWMLRLNQMMRKRRKSDANERNGVNYRISLLSELGWLRRHLELKSILDISLNYNVPYILHHQNQLSLVKSSPEFFLYWYPL